MKTNNQRLREIMKSEKLNRQQVAVLTMKSLDTVASWLRKPDDLGFRNMPNSALSFLESQLGMGQQR
jgi:hypothetical protein